VQFDTKTKTRKVIAFLSPYFTDKIGATPVGTFSSAIDPTGDKLYITWNVSRGSRAWDCLCPHGNPYSGVGAATVEFLLRLAGGLCRIFFCAYNSPHPMGGHRMALLTSENQRGVTCCKPAGIGLMGLTLADVLIFAPQ